MNEKPESDDFDEDGEMPNIESEESDFEFMLEDLRPKRGAAPQGEPAWRKLEKIREQKHTAAQISDFDDYDIGDDDASGKSKRRKRLDL